MQRRPVHQEERFTRRLRYPCHHFVIGNEREQEEKGVQHILFLSLISFLGGLTKAGRADILAWLAQEPRNFENEHYC